MADRKKKPEHDDAWWAAQRHAYIEKNDILLSDYPSWEWVSPYDFWRTIFPEGFLQPRGELWNVAERAWAEYDRLPDGRPYDGRPWWQA